MATMSDHLESEHFSYEREWEDIENMLHKAERKQNQWVTLFHAAKNDNDFALMKECARNKMALNGVIKTLRWTLGDKDITHPLE
tara:strand:+ start:1222 stop:1473 length:252 start_codon:yes stop_codon:yes gene_type:complete